MTLLDMFEIVVRKLPSSSALIQEDGKKFNYRIVDEIAIRLGKELACAIAVAPVDEGRDETPLVAVMMTRGIGLVTAILGILKAGAAYVPVDPAFPPDRQTHIFAHSKCQVLITDAESLALALSLGVIVPPTIVVNVAAISSENCLTNNTLVLSTLQLPSFIYMDKEKTLNDARAKVGKRVDGGLAYVLYTSGSTGKPKGVMVKQAGVVNIVEWFANELKVGEKSRVLGLTTFCFDISVLEMFLPLVRGAALVMVNQSSQKDPFQLLDVIRDSKVTVVQATPTTYEMLFATGWTGDSTIDFLVGGEAFRPSLVVLAKNSKSLRNVYGPTETTIWSSSFTLPKDVSTLQTQNGVPIIPIGMPISETVLYIVTEDETSPKRIVTIGSEGELWIGGVGVAKGYLHAPDLTAKVFLNNPFDKGSVYRTGDIVKRLNDGMGDYVFVRRMDDQVKIDGFRIELAEIETVFATHSMIDKAVAVVRDGKLALYVKKAGGINLGRQQIDAIMAHAGRSLTHYMMPKHIVQVNSFPETANGKLDRKALRDPLDSERTDNSHSATITESDFDVDEDEEDQATERSTKRGQKYNNLSGEKSELKKAHTAMAQHICATVEKVRGRRPSASSSFASIGVDSLGAVMFIKYLSDSVGGIRIEPSKIYAPGVTIRTFAVDLYTRLMIENPEALVKLGIVRSVLTAIDEDDQVNGTSIDDEDEEEIEQYEGYKDVQKMESEFEDILTTNRALMEGLRGVFTFFVLYDHFHHPHSAINQDFTADTYLFIMISGFTTSLQLREVPVFVKADSASNSSEDSAVKTSGQAPIAPLEQIEAGNNDERYRLMPRQPLNFSRFMMNRLVGLLPIMWLGLFLNLPSWTIQANQPMKTKVVCSALYIVAMQSWWRPECGQYGPNNMLYASILVNCFLLYAFIRLIGSAIQNRLMSWASSNLSPITLTPPAESLKNRTWKQWVGDSMVLLAYNRTNMRMMIFTTLFWFIVTQGLFAIMLFNTIAKNALTFIPYFFAGTFAASVLENMHVAMWMWNRNEEQRASNGEKTSPTRQFIYDLLHHSSLKATRPWVHKSNLFSYFYISQINPVQPAQLMSCNLIDQYDFPDTTTEGTAMNNKPTERGMFFLACFQLWRFFPDLMAISIGFLMSTLGSLYDANVGTALWFIILPTVFLAFFIVPMLQVGSARYNFSRFFLECAPIGTMGYASYAIYLFQRQAFSFFAPYFYFGVRNHNLYATRSYNKWFEKLNGGYKLIAVIVLTVICWLVHKYFQDGFITYLYSKFLRRNKSSASI